MKFDSKVKGALAWTGLFVILAVPSADLLFGAKDAGANLATTSEKKPVAPTFLTPAAAKAELKNAAAEVAPGKLDLPKANPAKTDVVETASATVPADGDAVGTYLSKGKKLPDYISDADSAPAVKPAAAVVKPAAPVVVAKPVEVASVSPVMETPPVPLPRNARPKTPIVASVPASPAVKAEPPLIVDENDLANRQASLNQPKQPVEPFPLSDGDNSADNAGPALNNQPDDAPIVTGDQLEQWDSGSLAEYLARKGLLSKGAVQQDEPDDSPFNNQAPNRPQRPEKNFFLF